MNFPINIFAMFLKVILTINDFECVQRCIIQARYPIFKENAQLVFGEFGVVWHGVPKAGLAARHGRRYEFLVS